MVTSKPTRDQSASKNVNLAQASEDVKNLQKSQAAGTDERDECAEIVQFNLWE